jgi:Ca2+-binding RTX toxin-like protein
VTASYTDLQGTAEAVSSTATLAVANVNDLPTGSVTISGVAEQGRTLTASNSLADVDGLGSVTYTWKSGETVLGTGGSLLLGQSNVGQAITVTASYVDGFNTSESKVSAATLAVANVNDLPTGSVTISGVAEQGRTLTASNSLADADGLGQVTYTWKSGETVLGTGSSLLLGQSNVGQSISVTASYTDWQGTAEAVSSAATEAVPSANVEPIAQDTSVSVIEDTLLRGYFLAIDPNGDVLNYRIVQGPEHGTVSLSSDGSFLYRPSSNFNGLDSFQYVASDGLLDSNEATVSLNVEAVNDAPLGTGKTWTINEDNSLVLSPEVFGFRDVDAGDSLQAVRFTIIASKGSILLNGAAVAVGQEIAVSELQAGHLVYTPLANGYGAPYVNLRFQVSDGQDFSRASYMLSVKVNPVRDDLVLYGTDGNDTINGDLIDVGSLDQLYGLAGNDRLIGRYARDTIVGGTGADTIYGGPGSDILKFAAGDSGQVTGFDVVADYQMGARSTGDLIDYAKSMTIGGSAAVATATQASINASTGVATFASGSGTTMADALADVAARMTAASDAAGEMAFFQVSKKGHMMLFISDGVAGVTANDVVVQLMGISAINQIDLTGGNLTIFG